MAKDKVRSYIAQCTSSACFSSIIATYRLSFLLPTHAFPPSPITDLPPHTSFISDLVTIVACRRVCPHFIPYRAGSVDWSGGILGATALGILVTCLPHQSSNSCKGSSVVGRPPKRKMRRYSGVAIMVRRRRYIVQNVTTMECSMKHDELEYDGA